MQVDGDGDRAYWERHAKKYDRSLRPVQKTVRRMLELIGEGVASTDRVLEVAAGTGLVTPVLARQATEVVATDYAGAMVAALEAKVQELGLTNVRCEQADIYALPFEQDSFDAVVAANLLHLLPDLPAGIAALRRVLKPGGHLVVPTFCHDETRLSWVVSRLLALTGFPGRRRFTARTLREALEAEGLVVTRSVTLSGLIPIGHVQGHFSPG